MLQGFKSGYSFLKPDICHSFLKGKKVMVFNHHQNIFTKDSFLSKKTNENL